MAYTNEDASMVNQALNQLSSTALAIKNQKEQQKANEANQNLNQQNLDYVKATTQEQWERDDSAHQREVADLEAAGLSPLASMAGAGVTAGMNPPSMLGMQAPQFDINALVQSATALNNMGLRSAELAEQKRHNLSNENFKSSELELEAKKIKISADSLQLENKKVEETIRYQTRLNEIESRRIDEIIRSNKRGEELRLSEHESLEISRESQRYYEEITRQSGGKEIPYHVYSDFNEYTTAIQIYQQRLAEFIGKIGATQSAKANSKSRSSNLGFGAGASYLGTGVNGSGNGGSSDSSSNYSMENLSEKQKIMWYNFQSRNPRPIYIPKGQYKLKDKGAY